ncbi:mechanosensitive ion channel [Alkalibaculum sp. M08DMB]|uniref:Mechanosensitive ion channel n=1 Tax=Alkalibaculum sporogenes TaxID=2655001 RepID=A0A6A7K840_9FIRM|nr:mechanosensitive ion channel domain-containing protein [Alkalibaculum sporogenes]MPW25659.1 mechanosensitive ion channel [Alkalibaculum sporogenes]
MNSIFLLIIPIIQNIAIAIILGIVGLVLIKWISSKVEILFVKSTLDKGLVQYIASLVNILLKIMLVVSIVSVLGVDTSSFVAVLAAAGFAVGLAFQGTLSNFAGGILLLALRPFKVGDYIEADKFDGTVQTIQILYTELVTVDNKVIYIPNGKLSNESIVNYSTKDTRRLDLQFSVAYEEDVDKVNALLKDLLDNHPLVNKDNEPFVRLTEHGDSALIFTIRVWVNAPDYFTVKFDMMENVKKRFDQENIAIPYPQIDIHLDNTKMEKK